MVKYLGVLALTSVMTLTGCASIVNGTHQSISVHTGPVYGAVCSLENNKGRWFINNTPGSVVVNRSYNDLRINCDKRGYLHSMIKVKSHTKAMAFGNILFGGVIGIGVDMADGAAYDYPVNIYVPMEKA